MLLRIAPFFGLIVLLVSSLSSAAGAETYANMVQNLVAQGEARQAFRPQIEDQLFAMANSYRRERGKPALRRNSEMQPAARAHSYDMLTHGFLGHTASTGQDFDSRMRSLKGGAMVLPSMGENAVRSKSGNDNVNQVAARLFQAWLKSESHRRTLVSLDYLSVATGVATDGKQYYANQIFSGAPVVTNMQQQKEEPAEGGLY